MIIELNDIEKGVLASYFEAFYFADTGDDDDQLSNDADIAPETYRITAAEIIAFVAHFECYLNSLNTSWTWDQVGHDLYLTRQGNGAGFWDRGDLYGPYDNMLVKWSEKLGNVDHYLGDDGLIYRS
jgi:hypothetical protein